MRVLIAIALLFVATGSTFATDDKPIEFVKSFVEASRQVGKTQKDPPPNTLDGYDAVKEMVVEKLFLDPEPPLPNKRLDGIKDFAQVVCEFERNPALATTMILYQYKTREDPKEPLAVMVDLDFHDRHIRLPDGSSSTAVRWIVELRETKTGRKTEYKVLRVHLFAKIGEAPQGAFSLKLPSFPLIFGQIRSKILLFRTRFIHENALSIDDAALRAARHRRRH